MDVLVTTMQLTALGLNMHKACARGLILQFPFGANTMVQAMYCLYRLRQSETVVWRQRKPVV